MFPKKSVRDSINFVRVLTMSWTGVLCRYYHPSLPLQKITMGQSSKESATKIDFPIKTLSYDQKSLMMLHSTKVEPALSCKFKKEEAADFKEAIDEKMKEPDQVKKKAEESAENGSSDSVAAGRFRARVSGFGTTGAKDIDKELRQHFENCGGIQGISVYDRKAYIDFTSLESLFKALRQDKTSFCGRPLTMDRVVTNKFTFRAYISGLDTGARELDVLHHFKICGEIEHIDIDVTSPGCAEIYFASLDSLYKALELNNTMVGGHRVTVYKVFSHREFKAEIRGFDSGVGAEEALRKHFKECGKIVGISVGVKAGFACIGFANQDVLFKALELNNTKVGDHLVTVRTPEDYVNPINMLISEFRAGITWSGSIDPNALRSHFEKCGGIEGILLTGRNSAWIDFTNLDALNKALELDTCFIGNHKISVEKCSFYDLMGGY